jgi:hypothetical protein
MSAEKVIQEKVAPSKSSGVDWYAIPNASLAKVWSKEDYVEVCLSE